MVAGTIDLTPTWVGLLNYMIELSQNATTAEARKIAKEELLHMAQVADMMVDAQKKIKEANTRLEAALAQLPHLAPVAQKELIEINSILYNILNRAE